MRCGLQTVSRFTLAGSRPSHLLPAERLCGRRGPGGALVLDAVGNLVGTTFIGGAQNAGAIFRLGQNFNLLYSFCSKSGCIDGQYPQSAIALDLAGNVFGVTEKGGSKNYGGVFEFTP